jgi:methylmalonyl-CoA/ethylmalonyl-CoA epimerase
VKIHHIGYVVESIEKYKKNLVIHQSINSLYDSIQKAKLELIKCDNIYIELIEPQEKDAFTYAFMKKGGGYHHLCYEVETKEIALNLIKERRMIKVLDFVYAPLLGAEVIFAYNRNREVVEFVICQEK